ncbi:Gfo/Idh/MocA family oxidoreductase [Larkinella ripae]
MDETHNRRKFLGLATAASVGISLPFSSFSVTKPAFVAEGKRVGIIGLDTSHSTAFVKELNNPAAGPELDGYRVVAAYPKGSTDIESSVSRIAGYTEEVKKAGVEIVDSIEELLGKVDVVLLETNDGRLHREQALKVFKTGKRVFIDKPIAASLADVKAIFEAAKKANVPTFSASSLRYMTSAQAIAQGKTVGKVLGADAFSPAPIEKTHPDLFWYGIHGVETLFTVMGPGCRQVSRTHTKDSDVVVGVWNDERVGTFRGIRSGKTGYGGTAYGEKGIAPIGPYEGYKALLVQIVEFFKTGKPPVSPEETLEIFAFMEAADESKRKGGAPVTLESVLRKA